MKRTFHGPLPVFELYSAREYRHQGPLGLSCSTSVEHRSSLRPWIGRGLRGNADVRSGKVSPSER